MDQNCGGPSLPDYLNGGGYVAAPLTTMIIISWNYRELGNQRTVDVLTNLVKSKGPTILFLMKTKQSIVKMTKICGDLNFQLVFAVLSDGRSGGLGMFWKADCNLHIQTLSPNHIDAHILNENQQPWRLTGFYGYSKSSRKHESWRLLKHLQARSSLPWVCLGDFNDILHSDEKQGRLPKPFCTNVSLQRDTPTIWVGRSRVPRIFFHLP